MDFHEFWSKLQVELIQRKEFRSLARGTPFTAEFKSNEDGELFVKIIPSSGKPRGPISDYEFNGVWDNVKKWPIETRFVNKDDRLNPYPTKTRGIGTSEQVTYIVKLIEHIVGNQEME